MTQIWVEITQHFVECRGVNICFGKLKHAMGIFVMIWFEFIRLIIIFKNKVFLSTKNKVFLSNKVLTGRTIYIYELA